MVSALKFWTGKGFVEFFQNRRTGDEIKLLGSPGLEELCWSATKCDEHADEDIRVEDSLRHSIAHGFDGLVPASRLVRHRDARRVPACLCSSPRPDRGPQRGGLVVSSRLGTDRRGSSQPPGGLVPRQSRSPFSCAPDRAEKGTPVGHFWRCRSLPSDSLAHGCCEPQCTPRAYENPMS